VNNKQVGVLAILLASTMWAIEPTLAKLSYQNSDFLQTSAIRSIFAAMTALIYIMATKRTGLRINKQQLPSLVYIAVVGARFADVRYYLAMSQIPVVNAVVLAHMQPIFIVVIAFFVLKSDKLTKFDFLGISVMIISGLLVTTKTVENLINLQFGTVGDLIVLSATFTWATAAIVVRKYIKDTNAGVIAFYRFFFASVVFIIYLALISSINIDNIYQIFIGIIIGIGTILYYEGLKRIKAAQVSALELSTPFFAAILGFIVIGEIITIMQIVGILLLLVGIYCLSKKEE